MTEETLTPELLLQAYASGYFPMAESRESKELNWFCPELRGVLPLNTFHVPRSLYKTLLKTPFTFTTNQAFPEVIQACAEAQPNREESWINPTIIDLYTQLHRMGFAHSVECWQEGKLVGGLYGIGIASAFFGESMFSRVSNASKASLIYLVQTLTQASYSLLDTQYVNDHLKQFGAIEIPREEYLKQLEQALEITPKPCFYPPPKA